MCPGSTSTSSTPQAHCRFRGRRTCRSQTGESGSDRRSTRPDEWPDDRRPYDFRPQHRDRRSVGALDIAQKHVPHRRMLVADRPRDISAGRNARLGRRPSASREQGGPSQRRRRSCSQPASRLSQDGRPSTGLSPQLRHSSLSPINADLIRLPEKESRGVTIGLAMRNRRLLNNIGFAECRSPTHCGHFEISNAHQAPSRFPCKCIDR